MEFDSPDVEKDFPGLYASECGDGKSKKSKEESDFSEGDQGKKEPLIGRRKDKKDKKDRGYAALEGESSHEEDANPSKSKKSKAFKFTSSKSKEKREKSRDKESKDDEVSLREKDKKKEKERKEKDKKDKQKDKEKEKKDKKIKPVNTASVEVLELGDVQPVFGVNVGLATERSRCHDGVNLPLVVRDCIDYLQENSLKNEQIYKVEPLKSRLTTFKRLYNNRESQSSDELDMATACGLLKLFLKELPEPILTTDLMPRFEEVSSHADVAQQQVELQQLLEQLPSSNRTLIRWLLLHFDHVIQCEKTNKMNAQSLAMLLSPPLQISHRLLVTLLCHCSMLCADIQLTKYIPPITASSPKLPENSEEIQVELSKQESLLSQIHLEMNAGFVSKKREEQLWEVQRIITQLKRKLRSFERRQEKSLDESLILSQGSLSQDNTDQKLSAVKIENGVCAKTKSLDIVDSSSAGIEFKAHQVQHTINREQELSAETESNSKANELYVDEETGFLMVPKTHADYEQLIRLQLENQELLAWKSQLQAYIHSERAEILRLKQLYQQQQQNSNSTSKEQTTQDVASSEADYEKIIEHYIRENTLLEQKKKMLANAIFEERRQCISMQVELAMRNF